MKYMTRKLKHTDPQLKAGNPYRIGICLTGLCLLFAASGVWAHCKGNHTGDHPHCTGGGEEGRVFFIESLDPPVPLTEFFALDRESQMVFRNADMDLTQFTGSFDSGGACDHGFSHGIIVLKPKSN